MAFRHPRMCLVAYKLHSDPAKPPSYFSDHGLLLPRAAAHTVLLAGALSYIVGTFLVTGMGNVPLNNELAAASPDDAAARETWARYLVRWTRLNTARTIASALALGLFWAGTT